MRNAAKWGVVLLASLGFLVVGCSSSSCPGHFKTCGNACVDIYTDPANCGACGTACASGNVCSAGACALSCVATETACGGSCRDLQTDDANCGACGTACNPGQHCAAGACGCPPGMPHCGPTVLLYCDTQSFYPAPAAPEAIPAIESLKGSFIGPFATSGSNFPAFDAAYDLGAFDVVVFDDSDWFIHPPFGQEVVARLNDWVSCGGRLIFNSLSAMWYGGAVGTPNPALASLLGVDFANFYCGTPKDIFPDTTAANLWSGVASVPTPLHATEVSPWSGFCPSGYPLSYDLAPRAGGSIAARFTTAGTGTGAIAVTHGGRVIVHGFNPSEYRVADSNGDGKPDIQELYANEIAYVVKQGPPGLTCSSVEHFFTGPWPIPPWTAAGAAYGVVSAACAHDGANGFTDNVGGGGVGDWYYRTDVSVGNPGQKLSMWVRTGNTASSGRIFMGFGSNATSTWSMDIAPNAGSINLFRNNPYSSYSGLATASQAFSLNTWYRMEVEFGAAGAVTGRLYASDGVTVLNTITATLAGFTPGGVAFRSWGPTTANCVDTIKVY
jgi:hypothetical protein